VAKAGMKSKESTPKRSRGSSRNRSSSNGRSRRQSGAKGTVPEREYQDYELEHGTIGTEEEDVLLDVPVVNVDEIQLELDNLHARVSLHAEVLDLVKLSVGAHAEFSKLELDIKGVEAQALLKVHLDHVTAIIDRVLTTLDRNPQLIESLGRTVEQIGAGAGQAVEDVGEGAGSAVEDVGEGAEGAVKDVGKGAGGAVQQVGKGTGQAVGEIGQGTGQAVGGIGQGAGQAVGGLGEGVGGLAGGGAGAGQHPDALGGAGSGDGLTAPKLAKEATKALAKEVSAAAADEARDLGLAATHKVMEMGERRRQRRADRHHSTDAALRRAEEAGLDVDAIEGTGAKGRVTVKDVERAAKS
jgi:e3 binding domain